MRDKLERLQAALAPPTTAHASTATLRRAAVAICLHRSVPRVLLMRRVEDPNDRWSGQISLPGGHHEPSDHDLCVTAARETLEEVGVDPHGSGRVLGEMPTIQAKARGVIVPMRITPFVFVLEEDVSPVPGPEASEAFWFPLDRAVRGEFDEVYRYRRDDGAARELPSWRYDDRVIWGLTHQMLTSFNALLFPS